MSRHVIDLCQFLVRMLRRRRGRPFSRDPLELLEGAEIPAHLIGRPFNIIDQHGNVVATVNRHRFANHSKAMIG